MLGLQLHALVAELDDRVQIPAGEEQICLLHRHGHWRGIALQDLAHLLPVGVFGFFGGKAGGKYLRIDAGHFLEIFGRGAFGEFVARHGIQAALRLGDVSNHRRCPGGKICGGQCGEFFPGEHHGMRFVLQGVALEEVAPFVRHFLAKFELSSATLKGGPIFDECRLLGKGEVLGHALRFADLFMNRALEVHLLRGNSGHLAFIIAEGLLIRGFADHRQILLLRLHAAVEDGIHGVIIPARNGIILVVMAARAADGDAEHPAADDINAIVDLQIAVADEAVADIEKTKRRE